MEGFKLDGMSWRLHQVLSLSVDVGLLRNSSYFCTGEVGGDESYPWGGPGVTSEFYSRADSRCGFSKVTRWSSFFFFFFSSVILLHALDSIVFWLDGNPEVISFKYLDGRNKTPRVFADLPCLDMLVVQQVHKGIIHGFLCSLCASVHW